ncbi:MAG: hypothetical protein JW860_03430, partial [Sedimentisphaerales bacterium]|nr:hypothetical protein [Sedimentisphaerales bacterium]
ADYYSVSAPPADQWSLVTFNGFDAAEIAAYKARSYEIPMEPVTTTSAAQALTDVLDGAGASYPSRDVIDARIVNDVVNGTGDFVYNTPDLDTATPEEIEAFWPTLYSLPAPTDTDHDGMPDTWETANGLDLYNPADRNDYDLHPDYTNLEVYLNSLVAEPVLEMKLKCKPARLKPKTKSTTITVTFKTPKGIGEEYIDLSEPITFYPGGIEALDMTITEIGKGDKVKAKVTATFDASECKENLEAGKNTVYVVGKLMTGEYFEAVGSLRYKP